MTLREVGQEMIEQIARQVVLENDRTQLVALHELMNKVTQASLARGDFTGAWKTAEANQCYARAVERAVGALRSSLAPRSLAAEARA